MLKQVREPQFVSSAYFLKFRFEKGHYALAGREKIGDIEALKIEYYPRGGSVQGRPVASRTRRSRTKTTSKRR